MNQQHFTPPFVPFSIGHLSRFRGPKGEIGRQREFVHFGNEVASGDVGSDGLVMLVLEQK